MSKAKWWRRRRRALHAAVVSAQPKEEQWVCLSRRRRAVAEYPCTEAGMAQRLVDLEAEVERLRVEQYAPCGCSVPDCQHHRGLVERQTWRERAEQAEAQVDRYGTELGEKAIEIVRLKDRLREVVEALERIALGEYHGASYIAQQALEKNAAAQPKEESCG